MKHIFTVFSLLLLPTMLWAQQSPTQCAAAEEIPTTKTITVNGVDFEFVLVKSGTFRLTTEAGRTQTHLNYQKKILPTEKNGKKLKTRLRICAE